MATMEQYELVKSEGACPDCGSDVKKVFMKDLPQAAPRESEDPIWDGDDVGYACTGDDKTRGPCRYYINAGERA